MTLNRTVYLRGFFCVLVLGCMMITSHFVLISRKSYGFLVSDQTRFVENKTINNDQVDMDLAKNRTFLNHTTRSSKPQRLETVRDVGRFVMRKKIDTDQVDLDSPKYRTFLNQTTSFGLTKYFILKKSQEPRPLYKFTLEPWSYANITSENDDASDSSVWSTTFIVATANVHQDRRQTMRETWASQKARNVIDRMVVVFMVAQTKDEKLQQALVEENKIHGDLLQVDKEDSYRNIIHKSLAGLQWCSSNFPKHWMYTFCGDDISLDVIHYRKDLVLLTEERRKQLQEIFPNATLSREQVLQELPIYCADGNYHRFAENAIRSPNSKYYISFDEYPPQQFPPFCCGGFYTMPIKTAKQLYEKSRYLPYTWLEDTWVVGVLRLVLQTENGVLLSSYEQDKVKPYQVGLRAVFSSPPASHFLDGNAIPARLKKQWREIEKNVDTFNKSMN